MRLPRISEIDPSGMLSTEKRTAREIEKKVSLAIELAHRYVIENNITNPIIIDRVVAEVMSALESDLERLGITVVHDAEGKAIIRSNDIMIRMGVNSSLTTRVGIPREVTAELEVAVLNDVRSLAMDVRKNVSRILTEGMNQGLGATQLARNIREQTGGDKARASTIARTTVMKAYNRAAHEDFKRAGATGFSIFPSLDERFCDKCRKVVFDNGISGKLKEYTDYPGLPIHPNCRCTIVPIFEDSEDIVLFAPSKDDIFTFVQILYKEDMEAPDAI